MSKRAREEDLLEQVRELCEEPDKITTAMAVAKIREFGYQASAEVDSVAWLL